MISAIEESRNKRAKMLYGCLQEVVARDEAAFHEELDKYLKRYLRVELKDESIDEWISLDGTILWHVARNHGLQAPKLGEKEAALIVTAESLGIH